jgi:putative nucleotidyltransferase with HDIG domain
MKPIQIIRTVGLKLKSFFGVKRVRQWILAGVTSCLLVFMIFADPSPSFEVAVGEVAREDVLAPNRIVNRYQTEKLKEEASHQVELEAQDNLDYYIINPTASTQAVERVHVAFMEIKGALPDDYQSLPTDARQNLAKSIQNALMQNRGLDIPQESILIALSLSTEPLAEAEKAATTLASDIMKNERISVVDKVEMQRLINTKMQQMELNDDISVLAGGVVNSVIRPNLVLDTQLLQQKKDEAMANVSPVYVEQHQKIVGRGEIIEEEHMILMRDAGLIKLNFDVKRFIGICLSVVLLMSLLIVFIHHYQKDVLESERSLCLLSLVLLIISGLAKLFSLVTFWGMPYLVPIALGTMLITILINSNLALISSLFLAAVLSLITSDASGQVMLIALAGGISGVYSVSSISQRGDLTRAGLVVGVVNFITMICMGLINSDMNMVKYSALGLSNGLVSAIVTIGFLPYLESVFQITSSIRLLELSNPNHPLLRKLLMEAPGSYHHSIVVGNLAEAAADAIKGNSLLTRVGAQYHDIGKAKRPVFFVENQFVGDNPHDKISPSLSTLIIMSHVKDGVELAKQHKLPEVIIDFVREHHGDDLVRYFYHRAKESGQHEVNESEFRYSGPKPRSKETAIVMLADAVEAAVRSLKQPSPGHIEGLVRKIIKERLNDNQLDQSNLTLKDLDSIAEAFVMVLTGIYHRRIEYPQQILKEMEASGQA